MKAYNTAKLLFVVKWGTFTIPPGNISQILLLRCWQVCNSLIKHRTHFEVLPLNPCFGKNIQNVNPPGVRIVGLPDIIWDGQTSLKLCKQSCFHLCQCCSERRLWKKRIKPLGGRKSQLCCYTKLCKLAQVSHHCRVATFFFPTNWKPATILTQHWRFSFPKLSGFCQISKPSPVYSICTSSQSVCLPLFDMVHYSVMPPHKD